MYGGGFATVPAYLADMFGTQFVGAIHGRLLTAWSTAGIIGPVVVNYIREAQLAAGVPRDQLYDSTMYILCGMLVIGLICNFLVKPVDPKWYMSADEVAKLQAASAKTRPASTVGSFGIGKGGLDAKAAAILGLRRHSAGLGRVDHAGQRGKDFLIGYAVRGTGPYPSRGSSSGLGINASHRLLAPLLSPARSYGMAKHRPKVQMKLTMQKLKDMRRSGPPTSPSGLPRRGEPGAWPAMTAGYIEDCMGKS